MTAVSQELSKGERTRQTILDTAAEISSSEGLDGLTIGRLATELGMSKSGLFAHFGSKEELQLATVARAREIFYEAVFQPALAAPRGLRRLRALCDAWIDYADQKVFRGGCFFAAAATEFDTRPGPLRDAIAAAWREWLQALEIAVRKAQELGQIDSGLDARAFAYELNALATSANTYAQLLDEPEVWEQTRRAIQQRIDAVAGTESQ